MTARDRHGKRSGGTHPKEAQAAPSAGATTGPGGTPVCAGCPDAIGEGKRLHGGRVYFVKGYEKCPWMR